MRTQSGGQSGHHLAAVTQPPCRCTREGSCSDWRQKACHEIKVGIPPHVTTEKKVTSLQAQTKKGVYDSICKNCTKNKTVELNGDTWTFLGKTHKNQLTAVVSGEQEGLFLT